MSLLPFLLSDWEDLVCHSLLDQNLGLDLRRPKLLPCLPLPAETVNRLKLLPRQSRPDHELDELKEMLSRAIKRCESPSPVVNKDDFHVVLDVQHFRPEEIDVKIVDNHLVVEAKHEEKQDEHGSISRQFVRRYRLPQDVNIDNLTSRLSSDGLLTIVAPKKQPLKDESQRTLRIECTGKPFVNKKQEKPKTLEQRENIHPKYEALPLDPIVENKMPTNCYWAQLDIKDLRKEDAGMYTLMVRSELGGDSTHIKLTVKDPKGLSSKY